MAQLKNNVESLIFVGSDFHDFKILISPKPLKKSTK